MQSLVDAVELKCPISAQLVFVEPKGKRLKKRQEYEKKVKLNSKCILRMKHKMIPFLTFLFDLAQFMTRTASANTKQADITAHKYTPVSLNVLSP